MDDRKGISVLMARHDDDDDDDVHKTCFAWEILYKYFAFIIKSSGNIWAN